MIAVTLVQDKVTSHQAIAERLRLTVFAIEEDSPVGTAGIRISEADAQVDPGPQSEEGSVNGHISHGPL
jgi:hypothetical protein